MSRQPPVDAAENRPNTERPRAHCNCDGPEPRSDDAAVEGILEALDGPMVLADDAEVSQAVMLLAMQQ